MKYQIYLSRLNKIKIKTFALCNFLITDFSKTSVNSTYILEQCYIIEQCYITDHANISPISNFVFGASTTAMQWRRKWKKVLMERTIFCRGPRRVREYVIVLRIVSVKELEWWPSKTQIPVYYTVYKEIIQHTYHPFILHLRMK